MQARLVVGVLAGALGYLSFSSAAHAQCTMDTECKGDRVCENGACVSPPPGAVVGNPAPSPTVAPAPAAPPAPYAEPRSTRVEDTRPRMQRHSTGMMAGGIVMVSFVPIALLVAMVANLEQTACEGGTYYSSGGTDCGRFDATIYGGLFTSAVLVGVGIPMIVIGGKKEPLGTARLTPWASPHGAGLGLRVDL